MGPGPNKRMQRMRTRNTMFCNVLHSAVRVPASELRTLGPGGWIVISRFVFVFISMTALVASSDAQDFSRILVPLSQSSSPLPGAYGSLFVSRIALFNAGNAPVEVRGSAVCQSLCCLPPTALIPSVTYYDPNLLFPACSDANLQGSFLRVASVSLDKVHVSLHVQDLSRQLVTWGTDIPTVPEVSALSGTANITDVPVGSGFRSNLRIYAFGPSPVKDVRVDFLVAPDYTQCNSAIPPDTLLAQRLLTLTESCNDDLQPEYGQILDIGSIPELSTATTVRCRITPSDPQLRFWAFVSTTSNETQHITVEQAR